MADKFSVDRMDATKKNSPVAGPVSEEATVVMNAASDSCLWNDQSFAEGALVESEGRIYECSFGQWTLQK